MAFRLSGGHESGLGMRAKPNRVRSGRNGDGGKPQNTGSGWGESGVGFPATGAAGIGRVFVRIRARLIRRS